MNTWKLVFESVFFTALFLSVGCCTPTLSDSTGFEQKRKKESAPASWTAQPSRTRFLRQSGFNLPWISYGHDVGWPPRPGTPQQMGFGFFGPLIKSRAVPVNKMGALRVWAFADNRSGFLGPRVQPGFTARCIRDMSAFMDSTPSNTTIIWVLYDYMIADGIGSEWGGRAGETRRSLSSPDGWREAWSRTADCLSFMQKRYGHRIIWDIINEPLNGMRMVVDDKDSYNIKGFVWKHMKELLAMGGRVSLGVRNLGTLLHFWAPIMRKAQREIRANNLPTNHLIVQFHHYPGHELSRENGIKGFSAETLKKEMNLDPDTPVLLGECLPNNGYTLSDYYEKGFSGVLFWQDASIKTNYKEVKRQIRELPAQRKRTPGDFPLRAQPPPPATVSEEPGVSLMADSSVVLSTCRSVTNGPPYDREWLEKMGGGFQSFQTPLTEENVGLLIPMDVDAHRWTPDEPFWTQKKRKGEILCSPLSQSLPVNLQDTVIEIEITPPVEAVAHPWGSGAQIVLQDDSGRRLHGHWTGLSKLSGGKKQVLRLRPPTKSVPGMGARHKGFRLDRVSHVGFLWAAATFAEIKFTAEFILHAIRIFPCGKAAADGEIGCSGDYPTYTAESINIWRPKKTKDLSLCMFTRSNYPYYSAITRLSSEDTLPWKRPPAPLLEKRKNHLSGETITLHASMDPENPFRQAGAISTNVSTDCPEFKGGALNLLGCSLSVKTSSTQYKGMKIQFTLRDLDGVVCYTRSTARPGEIFTVPIGYGPETCSAGKGVDFKRIQNIGLVFNRDPEWSTTMDETLKLERFTITPASL